MTPPRERDVLALLVDGLSNKEISARLAISVHGVKRHMSSMLSKLNSPGRSHLVSSVLRAEADARPALAFTRASEPLTAGRWGGVGPKVRPWATPSWT